MPSEVMFGQKFIMLVERAITSWMVVNIMDKMSREELLVAQIRQLERRPEDVERARAKVQEARLKNKEQFDRLHRLRPRKVEQGNWVLVYDNSLENQHRSIRKFANRWFGLYVVTSAKDNATYHLAELEGMRIAVPVAGKQ